MAFSSPLPSPVHIAILGASISGLSLAIALQTHAPNLRFTIYESRADIHAVGAGIVFGPNALRAMELIDARLKSRYESVATGNGTREKENVFHDMLLAEPGFGFCRKELRISEGGEEVAYLGFRKSGVHRADLMALMASLVPGGDLRFGKRVVDLRQVDERVRISFTDGDVVDVDAVVGCDGGNGISRAAVLGDRYPEFVKATYARRYVYRTVVPIEVARGIIGGRYVEDGKMFMGRDCYFTTYPMSKGTLLNVLAARQRDEEWKHEEWTYEVSMEEMLKDFEGCDDKLVKLLEHAKPVRWSLNHHLSTPTYHNRHICLLGDSAHAMTPHQGAGAGQCLEDALILSHLLGLATTPAPPSSPASSDVRTPSANIATAFQAYDEIRRGRAQEIVRTSEEAGKMYCLSDPDCGDDLGKIVLNARKRFHCIWDHDLQNDLDLARRRFFEVL